MGSRHAPVPLALETDLVVQRSRGITNIIIIIVSFFFFHSYPAHTFMAELSIPSYNIFVFFA